jgi:hypothetical protein
MRKERKFEIGYLLFVQRLQKEGVLFNTTLKHQLDEASSTLQIPQGDMRDFAVLLAQDVAVL